MGSAFNLLAVKGAHGSQSVKALASDGANFLLVWQDQNDMSLYGQLVTSAGTLSGSEFLISNQQQNGNSAAAAFGKTNYLVAWQSNNNNTGGDNKTYGEFVSQSGVAGSPFQINQTNSTDQNPLGVAFDGTNYLVAWNWDIGSGSGPVTNFDIHGRIVSQTGAFPGNELNLVTDLGSQVFPVLAFDGTNYLLAWGDDPFGASPDIRFRFFDRSGNPAGSAFTLFTAQGSNTPLFAISGLIFGGGRFTIAGTLGTLQRDANGNATGFATADVYGTLLQASTRLLPEIISPTLAAGMAGQQFVYQFETRFATSLAVTNLPAGLTFDTALAAITGKPATAGTFSIGLGATNTAGTTTATIALNVRPVPSGPTIVSSTAVTGRTGQFFTFGVITKGGSPATRLSATNLPSGLTADPVSGRISGFPRADGSFAVALTATDGMSSDMSSLQLTFTSDPARPVITSSDHASLAPGQAFLYKIIAPSSDPVSFSYVGDLPSGLSFDATTGTISGIYTGPAARNGPSPTAPTLSGGILGTIQLFATTIHGTATFQLRFLSKPSGTVNISTRTTVGRGNDVLIGGFIITGDAPEGVIVRAIGPSLNLEGELQDPILELHNAAGQTVANDDWRNSQGPLIVDTKVPPTDSRECAIIAGLDPGNYTAVVGGKGDTTGISVVEIYDLGTAALNIGSKAKLAQISTRGTVGTGNDVLIGGFIVDILPTKVILRAIGPELNGLLPGALQDTTLELRDGSGSLIASNDDWRSMEEAQIIETTVPPLDDRESAIVATLDPGNYTAIVRGKNNTTGVALVEVYSLQ